MDVKQILSQARIDYITSGKNVKKGNVYIHCPFCGDEDPSHHLGINEVTGAWGCWRNAGHRGVALKTLVIKLIGPTGASFFEDGATSLPDGFDAAVASMTETNKPTPKPMKIEWPSGTERIAEMRKNSIVREFVLNYLKERGFKNPVDFCEYYDLRYCRDHGWNHRILLPVYHYGKLIGWTGRAITESTLRYKAWPTGSAIKQAVFNHDHALDNDEATTLIITEGPFDAMKLDWFTCHRARTIALMSTSATEAQQRVIIELATQYKRTIILLDSGTTQESFILAEQLAPIHPVIGKLPADIKDPGELYVYEAIDLVNSLI